MSSVVTVDVKDGIGWITMNRPEALNALNDDVRAGLLKASAQLEHDAAARCVVLRGAGDHFMAGGDIKRFYDRVTNDQAGHAAQMEAGVNAIHAVNYAFRRMAKPTICAIQGAAAGYGLSLAMTTDLAIAADDAFFTLAYANIGFSADGGSTYLLPRIVGTRKALEIAFLAERFNAQKALELGIVNWVVPRAQLEAETLKLATRLANGPTIAYAQVKRLMHDSLQNNFDSQLHREAEAMAVCAATADHREGIIAFVEKRKPVFRGR